MMLSTFFWSTLTSSDKEFMEALNMCLKMEDKISLFRWMIWLFTQLLKVNDWLIFGDSHMEISSKLNGWIWIPLLRVKWSYFIISKSWRLLIAILWIFLSRYWRDTFIISILKILFKHALITIHGLTLNHMWCQSSIISEDPNFGGQKVDQWRMALKRMNSDLKRSSLDSQVIIEQ